MEECEVSMSTGTIRAVHIVQEQHSQTSSPKSALPSPLNSPSADSISSLPSVSSSFFYSSGAASPHHQHSDHSRADSDDLPLVIPSLTLPSALPRSTIYGQTIGDLRILLLGAKGIGKTTLANLLLEKNEDVVDVHGWEYFDEESRANVLRASTDWIEHGDAHGLEKFEPARNIEIIELPGYGQHAEASTLTQSVLSLIHTQFKAIHEIVDPDHPPSQILANLVSSPYIPFYTTLVFLTTSVPSPLEYSLIDSLSQHIPIIVLPTIPSKRHSSHLSSFRPATSMALRSGLFNSPEILATLRLEAADRFLRWREVERTVYSLSTDPVLVSPVRPHSHPRRSTKGSVRWNKAEWEAEWEYSLSQEVARRRSTIMVPSASPTISHAHRSPSFDPLHLPSLIMFSLSLLNPLRARIFDGSPLRTRLSRLPSWGLLTVVGAFCAGIGIGLMLS